MGIMRHRRDRSVRRLGGLGWARAKAALREYRGRARPIVRPGAKPLWGGSFPSLSHQALLYVASKVSASAIAAYTHDV